MNLLLETPALETATIDLGRDRVRGARRTTGSPPHPGRSGLRGLRATVRTKDARRDDLERTHWRKVWRSMQED